MSRTGFKPSDLHLMHSMAMAGRGGFSYANMYDSEDDSLVSVEISEDDDDS